MGRNHFANYFDFKKNSSPYKLHGGQPTFINVGCSLLTVQCASNGGIPSERVVAQRFNRAGDAEDLEGGAPREGIFPNCFQPVG